MIDRREMITGLAAVSAMATEAHDNVSHLPNTYFELKTWRLRTSEENQGARLAEYLETGLMPAVKAAGGSLAGAFANLIGPDGPYYVSLAQYPSLSVFQSTVDFLATDAAHQRALSKLSATSQFPFARVESSLLRSFDIMPAAAVSAPEDKHTARIFELRTYESPSYLTLGRKVAMFNQGEAKIFERLKMGPIFFGETIIGPRQPNLTYMLSFDDLTAREDLWHSFATDSEWKSLSSKPELKDPEIVTSISNVILRPLPFSLIR